MKKRGMKTVGRLAGLVLSASAVGAICGSAAGSPIRGAWSEDLRSQSSIVDEGASPESGSVLEALLRASDRRAELEGKDSAAERDRLMAQLRIATHCFVENPTPEQLENIVTMYGALPPGLVMARGLNNRFFTGTDIWSGEPAVGVPAVTIPVDPTILGPATRIRLTYSFPADGVPWGTGGQTNDLGQQLRDMFPESGVDRGRELIRQAIAQWTLACAVTYEELNDNNEPLNNGPSTPPTSLLLGNGDIRLGAFAQSTGSGVLAYNFLPGSGGDMAINSSFFPQYRLQVSNNFRLFRNALAHEHGHGLGFLHSVPCSQTKLLEPFSSSVYDGPQIDDLRGAQQMYGDRFAPNHTSATAYNLTSDYGPLSNAAGDMGVSVREQNLSTNGPAIRSDSSTNPTGEDWFQFRLDSNQPVRITVRPTGGTYSNGPQTLDMTDDACAGEIIALEAAQSAGNLNFQLYRAVDLSTVLGGAGQSAVEGQLEQVQFASGTFFGPLLANTYLLRVWDAGAAVAQPKPVQLYDLEIRVGSPTTAAQQFKYPPLAVAGINKRIAVNEPCSFIGDLLSRAREPGIALRTQQFEWDITGVGGVPGADGVFEITNNPVDPVAIPPTPLSPPGLLRQPVYTYTANGVFPATLRVTDDNGLVDTHTIMVTVTGVPIEVTAITPNSGRQGETLSVTITGLNLGAVSDISQISLPGSTGITLSAPSGIVVSGGGTQIDGVVLTIASSAPLGFRDLRVTDGTTTDTLAPAFEVRRMLMPPANDLCDNSVEWTMPMVDLGAPSYVCVVSHPFNNTDANRTFPQEFAGTPCDPIGMFADVWYRWQVRKTGRLTVSTNSLPLFSSRVAVYRTWTCGALTLGPPFDRLVGCGIDGIPFSFDVNDGDQLLFRVGSTVENTGGNGWVDLALLPLFGACCNGATGACTLVAEAGCDANQETFQGRGTVCGGCPSPTGACCFPDGTCGIAGNGMPTTLSVCATAGGMYRGAQTVCATANCPVTTQGACCNPVTGACEMTTLDLCLPPGVWTAQMCGSLTCTANMGACCAPDGTCSFRPRPDCDMVTGIYSGDAVLCAAVMCAQPMGACCDPFDGSCANVTSAVCAGTGGVFAGAGTTCATQTCTQPPMGRCCLISSCVMTQQSNCNGGFTAGGTCVPDPCPVYGACCVGAACSGAIPITAAACIAAGGTFLGRNSTCGGSPCSVFNGACCLSAGNCFVDTSSACTTANGNFRGPNSDCSPNPCPLPIGACCAGTICSIAPQASCNGRWGGSGTTCPVATCCQADVNGQSGLTVEDIFDFLGLWFTGDPAANFDGTPGILIDDVFAFLTAYFTGC